MAAQRHPSAAAVEIVMRIKSFIVACVANGRGRGARSGSCAELRGLHRCPGLERVLPERRVAEESRRSRSDARPRRSTARTIRSRGCRWRSFMNRLGVALTPVDLAPVNAAAVVDQPDAQSGAVRDACPRFRCRRDVSASRLRERCRASFVARRSRSTSSRTFSYRPTTARRGPRSQTATTTRRCTPDRRLPQHVSLAPFGWVDLAVGADRALRASGSRASPARARASWPAATLPSRSAIATRPVVSLSTPERVQRVDLSHDGAGWRRRRLWTGSMCQNRPRCRPVAAPALDSRRMRPRHAARSREDGAGDPRARGVGALRAGAGQHRPASRAALRRRWRCSTCVPTFRWT